MQQTDHPSPGTYQHYKGNKYLVLGTVQHTEDEEYLVVYQCLYGDMRLWARPLTMFMEKVSKDGIWVPRFQLLAAKEPAF